jgi:hypothetical protein
MAFHPFHYFRKHQKPIFAVLAIVCMLVFIMQFGIGDPFSRAMAWFGWGKSRGTTVTTLYDRKVTTSELAKVQANRKMADVFLLDAIREGQGKAIDSARTVLEKASFYQTPLMPPPAGAQEMPPPGSIKEVLNSIWSRQIFGRQMPPELIFRQIIGELQTLSLAQGLAGGKQEEAAAIADLMAVLSFEAAMLDPKRPRDEHFFGGSDRTEDLLDFLIWKEQAKRLGITLVEADVRKAVNREARRDVLAKPFASDERVKAFLKAYLPARGLTVSDLEEAVADEFRVVLAKEALLGVEPPVQQASGLREGVLVSPEVPTPHQFLRFYRDNRTLLTVALLPVPVSAFKAQVQGEPSAAEKERLFERYKGEEPAPFSDTPGFKEPRRVKIEHVSARADQPFYREEAVRQILASYLLRVPGGVVLPFGGVAPWAVNLAHAGAFVQPRPGADEKRPDYFPPQDPVNPAYEAYRDEQRGLPYLGRRLDLSPEQPGKPKVEIWGVLHDANLHRLGPLTFTTGMALALPGLAPAGSAGAPALVASWLGSAAIYEQPDQRRLLYAQLALWGQSISPPVGVFGLNVPLGPAAYAPPVLPREEMYGRLLEKAISEKAPRIMRENLENFATELAKFKGRPDKAAEFLKDNLKKFGLEGRLRSMSEARDRFELATDPALKELRDAYEAGWKLQEGKRPDFADFLLMGTSTFDPVIWSSEFRQIPRDRLREREVREPFVIWRAQDVPAREPKSLAEKGVADRVIDAWRTLEARRLARKKAELLQERVKIAQKRVTPAEVVKLLADLRQEVADRDHVQLGEVFELSNVARLVRSRSVRAEIAVEYAPYQPPADRIPYPRPNFVDQLMTLKNEGDSVLLSDRPESHYYVAVLLKREVPLLRAGAGPANPDQPTFLELYAQPPHLDTLWGRQCLADRRRDWRKEYLKQLRVDAGAKVDENGNYVLPEGVRNRTDEGGSSD